MTTTVDEITITQLMPWKSGTNRARSSPLADCRHD
jgi:hypothetical protein